MLYSMLIMMMVLPALVGYGHALRLRLHIELPLSFLRELTIDGFLGLLVLATIAVLLNFAIALSGVIALTLIAFGWLLFFLCHPSQRAKPKVAEAIVLLILFLFIVLQSARAVTYFDTGLYHFQCVLWSKQQALPLGLANLYGRLGINSFWFPLAATLWLPGFSIASCLCIAGIIIFLFGCLIADCVRHILTTPAGYTSISDWFGVLCIYPWVYWSFAATLPEIVSLSTDLPVLLFTLAAIILVLPRNTSSDEPLDTRLSAAVLLVLLAVTVKLSAAPLLAGFGAGLVWLWIRQIIHRWNGEPSGSGKVVGRTITVSAVMIALWLFRSVWLSGCPLFPSLVGRVSAVRWAVPTNIPLIGWVRSFARDTSGTPEATLSSWKWFVPWMSKILMSEPIIIFLSVAGVAVILCVIYARKWPRPAIALWLLSALGVWFWFATAPDPRFGYGCIFAVAAIPASVAVSQIGWMRRRPIAILVCLLLCFVPLLRRKILPIFDSPGFLVAPWVPNPARIEKRTDQGVVVYIPADGVCPWAAPIPSTPYFRPALLVERSTSGDYRAFLLTAWEK